MKSQHTPHVSALPVGRLASVFCLLCATLLWVASGQATSAEPFQGSENPPLPNDQLTWQFTMRQPREDIEELPPVSDSDPSGPATPAELMLSEVEQLALSRHPLVFQALAEFQASRGRWLQVGLKPNPILGYMASEVGNDGQAGQQGAFVGQTFVRGGKLQLNRAVASREIVMQQQAIVAAEQQVLTDARLAFYELLVIQGRSEILERLAELTEQAESTALQLYEARESPKTDYLQASVELDRVQMEVRTTAIAQRQAQKVLAARLALEQLPAERVAGDLEHPTDDLVGSEVLDLVLASHPSVLKAQADVQRARWQIAREQAQVIPDLESQAAVQYDDATGYTVASVQAGLILPLWNRNQGAISAAWSEMRAAQQRVEQARLSLRRELADEFNEYEAARQRVEMYRDEILPQSAETQRLTAQAYRQGEVGFLIYLTAQRTFFASSLNYLDALRAHWLSRSRILGKLPPSPSVP